MFHIPQDLLPVYKKKKKMKGLQKRDAFPYKAHEVSSTYGLHNLLLSSVLLQLQENPILIKKNVSEKRTQTTLVVWGLYNQFPKLASKRRLYQHEDRRVLKVISNEFSPCGRCDHNHEITSEEEKCPFALSDSR